MVYHRILNIAPCAIQEDLVVYPSTVYFKSDSYYYSENISSVLTDSREGDKNTPLQDMSLWPSFELKVI